MQVALRHIFFQVSVLSDKGEQKSDIHHINLDYLSTNLNTANEKLSKAIKKELYKIVSTL